MRGMPPCAGGGGASGVQAPHVLQRRLQAVGVVAVVAVVAQQHAALVVVGPAHAARVPGGEGPAGATTGA